MIINRWYIHFARYLRLWTSEKYVIRGQQGQRLGKEGEKGGENRTRRRDHGRAYEPRVGAWAVLHVIHKSLLTVCYLSGIVLGTEDMGKSNHSPYPKFGSRDFNINR